MFTFVVAPFFVRFLVKRAVLYIFGETTKKSATHERNFMMGCLLIKLHSNLASSLLAILSCSASCVKATDLSGLVDTGPLVFFYKAEHICLMIRKKNKF